MAHSSLSRSEVDSDLYTFGYRFKPWIGKPIATAAEILAYLGEVIDENGLGSRIRYRHSISSARWSSAENLWTVEATRTDVEETVRLTANFLWMCQGYYRHAGYTPAWDGMDEFKGRIAHPQAWPEDLDYAGKNVVVIGSGATAATLIPAIAADCAHVTMLQRSPAYFIPSRNANALANTLRELDIKQEWIKSSAGKSSMTRPRSLAAASASRRPSKQDLLLAVRAYLGPDYDVETHFTPKYRPWRQRIAFVPDGDLFRAISSKKVCVVTDGIDQFTENGIRTTSGETLEADIIVTATRFNLDVAGDIEFVIDGKPLVFSDTVTYRGMMFTGDASGEGTFGQFSGSRASGSAGGACLLDSPIERRRLSLL